MSSEKSDTREAVQWWDRVADRYAGSVWRAICSTGLPMPVALDVNRLTWMRFADHFATVAPGEIESWLCQTALRECERSGRLLSS